jgi:hypothetical protein
MAREHKHSAGLWLFAVPMRSSNRATRRNLPKKVFRHYAACVSTTFDTPSASMSAPGIPLLNPMRIGVSYKSYRSILFTRCRFCHPSTSRKTRLRGAYSPGEGAGVAPTIR